MRQIPVPIQKQQTLAATREYFEQATIKAHDRLSHLVDDIKLIRQREGLSLSQLGHACGVNSSTVWGWEQGITRPSNPVVLLALLIWAEELKKNPDLRLLPLDPLASR